jgi:dTDP-4-dehydrorhamnose reductase
LGFGEEAMKVEAESPLSKERLQNSEVLLIGSEGYIGTAIKAFLASKGINFYAPSISELDITNSDQVSEAFINFGGKAVIYCAGITDVSGIEKDEAIFDKAKKVNIDGARDVALACREKGLRFVMISSGYQRAGTDDHPGPYTEEAPFADEVEEMELLGRYAQTKLRGDREVREVFKDDPSKLAILYIDYPCGFVEGVGEKYQRDWYFKTLLKNYLRGIKPFNDQELTISPVKLIAEVVWIIIEKELSGSFNVAAKGVTNPHELTSYSMAKFGEDPSQVKPGSIRAYQEKLKSEGKKSVYPVRGGFDCRVSEERLAQAEPGFHYPSWQEAVDEMIEGLKAFWLQLKANQAVAS